MFTTNNLKRKQVILHFKCCLFF